VILNLGDILHPNRELSFLYTLNEKLPSASINPVTNQGLIEAYTVFVLPISNKKI